MKKDWFLQGLWRFDGYRVKKEGKRMLLFRSNWFYSNGFELNSESLDGYDKMIPIMKK